MIYMPKSVRTMFHGGVRGLRVGQRILPPSVTKTERSLFAFLDGAVAEGKTKAEDITQRPDRVYLGSKAEVGYLYAAQYPWDGGGAVYEVIPDPPVELDPDCSLAGLSWMAPSALIVRVVDPAVPLMPELLTGGKR